jgi:DnaJ-class molecular chaperone
MRCERCQGSGLDAEKLMRHTLTLICDECMGSGRAYCCDPAGSSQPNCWPIKGSDGLYDPIKVHE